MLTTILETFTRQKLSAEQAYCKLVDDIASGKPWPKNTVDICVAYGKSVHDLEADVSTKLAIIQAEADIVQADSMQAEIDRLCQEQHAAFEDHEAMVRRHRAEAEAAHVRLTTATNLHASARSRQGNLRFKATQLLANTPDPTDITSR